MSEKIIKTIIPGLVNGVVFQLRNLQNEIIVDSMTVKACQVKFEPIKIDIQLIFNRRIYKALYGTIKPYLRPLSYLTKEIEHKGEMFVPVDFFEVTDDHRTCPIEQDHGNTKVIKDLKAIAKNNVGFDVQFLPLWVVDQLRAWMFNVDNLSPDEFIEVTDENNPYK